MLGNAISHCDLVCYAVMQHKQPFSQVMTYGGQGAGSYVQEMSESVCML